MNDKQEADGNGKNGDAFDKVLFRGGGTLSVGVLMWMATTMSTLQTDISGLKASVIKVTTELEIVAPRDIKEQVSQLERVVLSKDDVQSIIQNNAPWKSERADVLGRLRALEERAK